LVAGRLKPSLLVLCASYGEDHLIVDLVNHLWEQTFLPNVITIFEVKGKDRIGLGLKYHLFLTKKRYDYICLLDTDSRLERTYFERCIWLLEHLPELGAVSGGLYVNKVLERLSGRRRDARGAGKVIRGSILYNIPKEDFPDVTWDTWINTRIKIKGMKALEFSGIKQSASRPTTRIANRDAARSGRLSYHFGYNPLLVAIKALLHRTQATTFLRGYWQARRQKWQLQDQKVRDYFGWSYFTRL
jgi:hypothetical protein